MSENTWTKHNHRQGDVKREAMIQISLFESTCKRQYWTTELQVLLSLKATTGTDDRGYGFFGYSFVDFVDDKPQFQVF